MALVYCNECGREVSDKAKFCPQCGYTFKIKGRGFAITSMVLGIVACTYCLPLVFATVVRMLPYSVSFFSLLEGGTVIVLFLSAFMLTVGVLSLIFGILSSVRGSKLKKTTAGISLGSISCLLSLICLIINIVLFVG